MRPDCLLESSVRLRLGVVVPAVFEEENCGFGKIVDRGEKKRARLFIVGDVHVGAILNEARKRCQVGRETRIAFSAAEGLDKRRFRVRAWERGVEVHVKLCALQRSKLEQRAHDSVRGVLDGTEEQRRADLLVILEEEEVGKLRARVLLCERLNF